MSRQPGASSGENSEFYRRSPTYKEKSFLPDTRVGQMFCFAVAVVIRRLPSCVDSKQGRWAPVLLPKVRFPRQGHACVQQMQKGLGCVWSSRDLLPGQTGKEHAGNLRIIEWFGLEGTLKII